jgi:hypothetical protein
MLKESLQKCKEARLAKSITLEEIAARTRINTKFLRAIEEGQLDVLPDIYIRIFLKNYIEYLGLDAQAVLAEFDGLSRPDQAEPEPDTGPGDETEADPEAEDPEDYLNPLKRMFPFILGIIFIFFFGYFIVGKLVKKEPEPAEPVPVKTTVPAPAGPAATPAAPVPAAPAIAPARPGAGPDSMRLTVRGIKHCWILAARDGRDTLHADFIKTGQVKEFTAAGKVFVKIGLSEGDSAGVALALNGKDLGRWGAPGTRLTKFTVTADGIDPATLVVRKIRKKAPADSTSAPTAPGNE